MTNSHTLRTIVLYFVPADILSRYPQTDYEDFPMPESSPLFCLPLGVCVEHWESNAQFPLPTFSTFILTNAQGCKVRVHLNSSHTWQHCLHHTSAGHLVVCHHVKQYPVDNEIHNLFLPRVLLYFIFKML